MDLAWLAAVLSPRDVALHPNFDERRQDLAPAFLAAVVLGDGWRFITQPGVSGLVQEVVYPDPAIEYVQKTFAAETLEEGLAELRGVLLGREPSDIARSCALTLLACCAAAELDDHDTCDKLIGELLKWTASTELPDNRLIRAVLLQQRSLRFRDSGRANSASSIEALRLLGDTDPAIYSRFELSRSVSWDSTETIEQIVATIRDAAYSLLSGDDLKSNETDGLVLTPYERIKAPDIQYLLHAHERAAEVYERFIDEEFDQRFRPSNVVTLGGRQAIDLFFVTLALELAGHGEVYGFRLACAKVRMLESSRHRSGAYLGDVLRLLRLAASKNIIDLALTWMRSSGPLDLLAADARRIITFRSMPERLRSVELRVLASAAEVLTQEESSVALDAVLRSLRSGVPPNLPGEWELDVIRTESAWRAAVALSNSSGRSDEVAALLFAESVTIKDDQIKDTSIARSLALMDWNSVSGKTKETWTNYLSSDGMTIPAIVSVVAPNLGASAMPSQTVGTDLDSVATWINISMHGGTPQQEIVNSAVPRVREQMRSIQEEAKSGQNSLGFPVGDIAAGLIVYFGVVELWPDLVSFLIDPAVFRAARSAAFERLAREARDIPEEIKDSLAASVDSILDIPDFAFGSGLVPYPEALRFLASAKIISNLKIVESIAQLASSRNEGRREAARTLELISRGEAEPWMLGFAIQLVGDEDVETRALAASSLARLAASSPDMAKLSHAHLISLLKEDGMLVPVLLLRSLRESGFELTNDVKSYIYWMRDNHISSTVRRSAMLLLRPEP